MALPNAWTQLQTAEATPKQSAAMDPSSNQYTQGLPLRSQSLAGQLKSNGVMLPMLDRLAGTATNQSPSFQWCAHNKPWAGNVQVEGDTRTTSKDKLQNENGSHRTIFQYTQHLSHTGLKADSRFRETWMLSNVLYRQIAMRNSWQNEPQRSDVQVAQTARYLDQGLITDLDFSPDGRYLAASCSSKEALLFNSNNGKLLRRFENAHTDSVSRVRFTSDFHFVTGSADSTIALWDIRKPTVEVNRLIGHSKPIRSLDFDSELSWLVTSAQDGQIRFWFLPTFHIKMESRMQYFDADYSARFRGVLFNCPNFNHACMSPSRLVICTNTNGTMYVIENLSLCHLKDDLRNIRFDDTFKLQMSWFSPNACPLRRNRVRMLLNEDYSPVTGSLVSSVSHTTFHPSLPILLIRMTTSRRTAFRQESKDWTCICSLQEYFIHRPNHKLSDINMLMSGFGSNIVEETLLYASEEPRFASFREKRLCFSRDGRLIASPNKFGVRILAFSKDLGRVDDIQLSQKHSSAVSSWPFSSVGPSELVPVVMLERPVASTICCKFSPTDILLAVGDSNSLVSFYQPSL